MVAPARGPNTSQTTIEVTWSTISAPENGLSSVTSYSLEWDTGTNGETWVREIGYLSNSLLTAYSVSDNIVAGQEY